MKKILSKKAKRRLCLFLSLLILFYTTACNYFKVKTTGPEGLAGIGKLQKEFFIHNQVDISGATQLWWLTEPEVSENHLAGKLEEVIIDTLVQAVNPYRDPSVQGDTIVSYRYNKRFHYEPGRPYRIKKSEKDILHEVHIYVEGPLMFAGQAAISLDNIREVHIIEKDTGKTTASYIFGTLGVIAGVFALLLIIVALTKSSCPYIYTFDGEAYIFQGEIYGGAIQRNLERHDFMPLPFLRPVDGEYRLRLSNELKERQYTDLAELMVVNHSTGSKVLLDSGGQPHLFSNPIPPRQALSEEGLDLSSSLSATDRSAFLFNEVETEIKAIHLSFPKPENAHTARLLLNAGNTLWLDYIFGEFSKKFGSFHSRWMEKQGRIPAEERWRQAIGQEFPLSIYLNTKHGWELVEHLPTVGPLASRDFVIPINIDRVAGEQIELCLQTGFFFWEVDYAALDFTDQQPLDIRKVQATLATGQDGVSRRAELAADDGLYFAQPVAGMVAELRFSAVPVPEGQSQSVFLHAKGYYEHVRDYTGLPKISELKKFREPGHFSDYSEAEYLQVLERQEELLTAIQ